MHTLRLAYATQFLIALIAVYVLWSQVGGQSHLDLMPWYLKLGLGAGAALAVVKATGAAVSQENAWNGRTLKWFGILLVLLGPVIPEGGLAEAYPRNPKCDRARHTDAHLRTDCGGAAAGLAGGSKQQSPVDL